MIKGNCKKSIGSLLKEVKRDHRKIEKEFALGEVDVITMYEDLIYYIEAKLDDIQKLEIYEPGVP